MEGSHRKKDKGAKNTPYNPIIKPGQALMFDARLTSLIPQAGGGVLLGRVYDVTGMWEIKVSIFGVGRERHTQHEC